jgi:hypothetical protein
LGVGVSGFGEAPRLSSLGSVFGSPEVAGLSLYPQLHSVSFAAFPPNTTAPSAFVPPVFAAFAVPSPSVSSVAALSASITSVLEQQLSGFSSRLAHLEAQQAPSNKRTLEVLADIKNKRSRFELETLQHMDSTLAGFSPSLPSSYECVGQARELIRQRSEMIIMAKKVGWDQVEACIFSSFFNLL